MANEPVSDADKKAKLSDLIANVHIAMLTTVDPPGALRSRPMAYLHPKEGFDGTVYFLTRATSGKVDEVAHEQTVNVSFADPKSQDYVSISGTATISRDHARIVALWNPLFKAWFPDGLDDPDIALIVVDAQSAEYWDSPNSAVVQLLGFVKATVTGKTIQPGDHQSVDLR